MTADSSSGVGQKKEEKKRDGASIFFRALGSDRHIFFRLTIFIRKVSKSFSCVDTAVKHSSTLHFILFFGLKSRSETLKMDLEYYLFL
jgi:hypothetical protein